LAIITHIQIQMAFLLRYPAAARKGVNKVSVTAIVNLSLCIDPPPTETRHRSQCLPY